VTRSGAWTHLSDEQVKQVLAMFTKLQLISGGKMIPVMKPAAWHS
jgi:hypothetical protein